MGASDKSLRHWAALCKNADMPSGPSFLLTTPSAVKVSAKILNSWLSQQGLCYTKWSVWEMLGFCLRTCVESVIWCLHLHLLIWHSHKSVIILLYCAAEGHSSFVVSTFSSYLQGWGFEPSALCVRSLHVLLMLWGLPPPVQRHPL